ncbi:MAG: glutamate-5-semialdehyde dehydrogenase [Lachnospiraceae bacterium]|nr:glutamate-5-semialdehyde dehydrogenase [Lachnospiraceae bacterium]
MDQTLREIGEEAKKAKYRLELLGEEEKNRALYTVAGALKEKEEEILAANEKDIQNGVEKGMHEGLLDRLRLTPERIDSIAVSLRQVADLPDPVGELLDEYDAENGLHIRKVRVPMGVIGIIYESRPNVTADAFALCFKAGSAVILKGGSDALNSNLAIVKVIKSALSECGITESAISIIASTDRAVTAEFMKMKDYVDLLIPRGGAGLIRSVVENSMIPVIETGTGNCHIFVDESADLDRAVEIIVHAKTQRIGVCNALESLVIHSAVKDRLLPRLKEALEKKNVEIRGDERVSSVIDCVPATEEDFGREYLDLIISMKVVDSVEEAIAHINHYTTHHSESILTEDPSHADKFLKEIDAACVYVNASTRFTDGFEFGLGAEIGISTQKLHARGPMGLKEITSYKYEITGDYLIRR